MMTSFMYQTQQLHGAAIATKSQSYLPSSGDGSGGGGNNNNNINSNNGSVSKLSSRRVRLGNCTSGADESAAADLRASVIMYAREIDITLSSDASSRDMNHVKFKLGTGSTVTTDKLIAIERKFPGAKFSDNTLSVPLNHGLIERSRSPEARDGSAMSRYQQFTAGPLLDFAADVMTIAVLLYWLKLF